MNVTAAGSSGRTIPRADFGRVTVFFGEKNGKYPDARSPVTLMRCSRADGCAWTTAASIAWADGA
jgi:hypothetical protein